VQSKFDDYSNHIGIRIYHELQRISHLPIRGAWRITHFLSGIVPKPEPKGPCVVKTLHGFRILVDPILDKGLERSLFDYGTYEEGTLRIMKHILKDNGFFIDIGANIGLMSLHAAKILSGGGKVLSFEPLPSTYDILCQNIIMNNFSNIEAVNSAIGSADGTVDIFDNMAINRGSASLIRPNHTESSHKIPIRRLDGYLDERRMRSPIDCIKIDVEGWELEVLKGAHRTLSGADAPVCIVESSTLHPTYGGNTQDIYSYLRNINSYKIFRLERGKEKPSRLLEIGHKDGLPEHDNLFCFLPEHVRRLPSRMFH
jgi:FkbM family methyltransferase